MGPGDSPEKDLDEELASLRKQLGELEQLVGEPAADSPVRVQASDSAGRALERILAVIEAQVGSFPPFLRPALEMPEVLANLWQQMSSAYLRNPMPALTKEKLFARLSRYCPVPYALIVHSCSLKQAGMPGGEILRWLERPVPASEADLAPCFALFSSVPRPLPSWPEPGSPLEEGMLQCALFAFLSRGRSLRCREELLGFLGPANYARLTAFMGYIRMHHHWLEAFEQPSQAEDKIIGFNLESLLEEEPRLASFFRSYQEEYPAMSMVEPAGAPVRGVEPLLPGILEEGPFGVAIFDPDYRIMKANGALCRLLGYPERDLESLSLPAITHPQDVATCIHAIDQVLSGARDRTRVEKRLLKRTKEVAWVELTASAVRREDGSPLYSLAFIDDITDRKQAEESLTSDQQIFETLLRVSHDGVFVFGSDLVCTLWNPAMERMFGIKKDDAVGRVVFEILPFMTNAGEDKYLLDALRGETVTLRNRTFRIAGSGKEGAYDADYSPLLDASGKVTGALAFIRDVTELMKVEERQRASEARYQDLFESANDIVYTHDLEGRITSINKAAERIAGYSRAEALQMNASQLVDQEYIKIACRMFERQVAGENPPPYDLEIVSKDGRRVAVEVSTHLISREGKPIGVQGIARDVTERKKTEEALQQAKQKLEDWVRELEQRTREMTLLSEMGDMLRACLTTEEAYTVIVRVAQQIFPVQSGALYVISPSRNLLEAVAVWGDSSLVERVFAPDECWGLRRGRVHWVEDSAVGLLCKHLHQPLPKGYLCVPMMAQSEALGILYLTQPADSPLKEAKQRLAVAMAEHIAMALSNLRLHETLRSQSIRDPVTGLFNRRFMEESLELELRRAARNRRPLGMIMLQIDNLQALSQSFGAEAEKAVLLELGSLLQTIIRKEDIACRFAAEKFTILLPQGSVEVSSQRAENLREMIRNLGVRYRGHPLGRVTVSAGIAGFPDHGRTGEAIIKAVEGALQSARDQGGDRIITAH